MNRIAILDGYGDFGAYRRRRSPTRRRARTFGLMSRNASRSHRRGRTAQQRKMGPCSRECRGDRRCLSACLKKR